TALFQKQMENTGFDIGRTQTPITPIMVGDAKLAKEFSRKLYEEGIFIQAIGYPTVPVGKSRLRAMLSAVHSENDLLWAVGCFEKIGKTLGILN
ncbi:MAG: 8-amino-7-oxononanoate synthase, partial [Candidatus Kuenenia stuttgartiensis]